MEDAKWLHEDEVDTAGMDIPADRQTSGLPFVYDNIDIPWEWFDAELTLSLCAATVECQRLKSLTDFKYIQY